MLEAPAIHERVGLSLRLAGIKGAEIIRVYSPGDPGGVRGYTTVEIVQGDKLFTCIVWVEKETIKAGRKVDREKVRKFTGWRGCDGWEEPDD